MKMEYKLKTVVDGTTITRLVDKKKVTLVGQEELSFLRAVAYVAGDKNISDDEYILKFNDISSRNFG